MYWTQIVTHQGTFLVIYYSLKRKKAKCICFQVAYERPKAKEEETVSRTNRLFYSLLTKGLAKNLTVLVLEGCCDNEILKLLGQHCTHLTKLDVRNSWFVDDNGCKYLCLKVNAVRENYLIKFYQKSYMHCSHYRTPVQFEISAKEILTHLNYY